MATMFPCPSCGGQLRFYIPKQNLRCESCGSMYEVKDYKPDERINIEEVATKIYQCPNCGGEIQLIDNDGMEFCPFCGTQATMEEKFSNEGLPKYIMPFSISRKQAKNRYEKATKGVWFAPDGLNDDENIEKMVAMYVPYYVYDYSLNDDITFKGDKSYTSGGYDYVNRANVDVKMEVESLKIPFDASQALDDTIAEQVEPFMLENVKEFNPNYLAGFFVENSTVEKDLYVEDSNEKAIEYFSNQVVSNAKGYTPEFNEKKHISEKIKGDINYKGAEGAYMPLYFLTTRYGDRVAYSIMNGATGKLFTDMPIEKRKLFKTSMMVSAIIFAVIILLSFIFSFSFKVKVLCSIGAFSSALIAVIGAKLANDSYCKDHHIYDKGYFKSKENLSKEVEKAEKKKPANPFLISFIIIIIIAMVMFAMTLGGGFFGMFLSPALYAISVFMIIFAFGFIKKGDKKVMLLGIAGWTISIAIRIVNPPSDIYYYGALIVALLVIIYSANAIVDEYNKFATRPSPHFNKKGGGLERA